MEPQGTASETAIFNFEGQEVRFVGTADKPEWVAADVVEILYPAAARNKNHSTYLAKVPSEWKGSRQLATLRGEQTVTTLFEPGLYHLITRSDSMKAVPFQNWVFEDVLPSVRKTGSYSIPNKQASQTTTQLNADSFIQMIEQDLEHLGVATAFIKGS